MTRADAVSTSLLAVGLIAMIVRQVTDHPGVVIPTIVAILVVARIAALCIAWAAERFACEHESNRFTDGMMWRLIA